MNKDTRQEDMLEQRHSLRLKQTNTETLYCKLNELPVHVSSRQLHRSNYPPPIGEVPYGAAT
jgi:hypothetical protein